ncbi:hypothetical protein PQR75_23280 [Paraburkholderia fungorum]|uniref:hypothetical protein n=1 Tax=Paraburkholderia fungorum TaxID=134537 RepID=UPI0038B7A53A
MNSTIDSWRPWRKRSPELLARYVVREAAAKAVEDAWQARGNKGSFFSTDPGTPTFHDLLLQHRHLEIARILYERLTTLGIEYAHEPSYIEGDPSDAEQLIREPGKLLANGGGNGTCIDLALLFAGLAVEIGLLPLMVLMRSHGPHQDQTHAFVVIEQDRIAENENRLGWRQADWQRGWRSEPDGGQLLLERIRAAHGRICAIECTGFARCTTGREHEILPFADATREAERYLETMTHETTVNVVTLQKLKGFTPYSPNERMVARLPRRRAKASTYVGRHWIFKSLSTFAETHACGYFCVVGDAGLGKSALAIEAGRRFNCPLFQFSISEGRTTLDDCFLDLWQDLTERTLFSGDVPAKLGWAPILSLMVRLRDIKKAPVWLVVDAADEAMSAFGANPLHLPKDLPDGLFVLVTSRTRVLIEALGETALETLLIQAEDSRQLRDLKDFLDQQMSGPALKQQLTMMGIGVEDAVRKFASASGGNFMYLHYLLADLREGRAPSPDKLPTGLQGYYERIWEGIVTTRVSEGWDTWQELYSPVIAFLGAALEPVTVDWLALHVGRSTDEVLFRALERWRRFLSHDEATNRWRIVHRSFADFLGKRHESEVRKAHKRIAYAALQSWGGLENGLHELPRQLKASPVQAYYWRHTVSHLCLAQDTGIARTLVAHPTWIAGCDAIDPSGSARHSEWAVIQASITAANAESIRRGTKPDLSAEVACALQMTGIEGISDAVTSEMLEALVQSGYWKIETALAVIRLNLSIRPDLAFAFVTFASRLSDEELIEEALNLLDRHKIASRPPHTALLVRLMTFNPEAAIERALALPDEDKADAITDIVKFAPLSSWHRIFDHTVQLVTRQTPFSSPEKIYKVLIAVVSRAPGERLKDVYDVLVDLRKAVPHWSILPLATLVVRALELEMAADARFYLGSLLAIKGESSVPVALADVVKRLRELELAHDIQREITEIIIQRWKKFSARKTHSFEGKIQQLCRFMKIFSDDERALLLEPLLDEDFSDDHYFTIHILIPLLPLASLDKVVQKIHHLADFKGHFLERVIARYGEMGELDRALSMAKEARDSLDRGNAIVGLLPAMARRGRIDEAIEIAVRIARGKEGRQHQAAAAIAAISPYVDASGVERLLLAMDDLPNEDDRRRARLAIAPTVARLGQQERALALAGHVNEASARAYVKVQLALARAQLAQEVSGALDDLLEMQPGYRQLTGLAMLAPQLGNEGAQRALAYLISVNDTSLDLEDGIAKRAAIRAMLVRSAVDGAFKDAWAQALELWQIDRSLYAGALIEVAHTLAEENRHALLWQWAEPVLHQQSPPDASQMEVLIAIIPMFDRNDLDSAYSLLSKAGWSRQHRFDDVRIAIAHGYAALGDCNAALNLARSTVSSLAERKLGMFTCNGASVYHIGALAPVLDTSTVDELLNMSWGEADNSYLTDGWLKLLKRLAQISDSKAALQRLFDEPRAMVLGSEAVRILADIVDLDSLQRLESFELKILDSKSPDALESSSEDSEALTALAVAYCQHGDRAGASRIEQIMHQYDMFSPFFVEKLAPWMDASQLKSAISRYPFFVERILPHLAKKGRLHAETAIELLRTVSSEGRFNALRNIVLSVPATLPQEDLHVLWAQALANAIRGNRAELLFELGMLLLWAYRLEGSAVLSGVLREVNLYSVGP